MYIYSYQGRHSVRISEKYGIQKSEDHMEVGKHMHSYICIHTYVHVALYFKIMPWQTDTCTNGIVSALRNHVDITLTQKAMHASGIQWTQV